MSFTAPLTVVKDTLSGSDLVSRGAGWTTFSGPGNKTTTFSGPGNKTVVDTGGKIASGLWGNITGGLLGKIIAGGLLFTVREFIDSVGKGVGVGGGTLLAVFVRVLLGLTSEHFVRCVECE